MYGRPSYTTEYEMVAALFVAVRCPVCGRRQSVDVPPGTMVSVKCLQCGCKFEREVRG